MREERYISVVLSQSLRESESMEVALKKKYLYVVMLAKLEVLDDVFTALSECKSMDDVRRVIERIEGAIYDLLDWMRISRLEHDWISHQIRRNEGRTTCKVIAKYY